MAGMGVLNGMFLTFGMTHELDYKISFGISSGVSVVVALFIFYAITDAKSEHRAIEQLPLK